MIHPPSATMIHPPFGWSHRLSSSLTAWTHVHFVFIGIQPIPLFSPCYACSQNLESSLAYRSSYSQSFAFAGSFLWLHGLLLPKGLKNWLECTKQHRCLWQEEKDSHYADQAYCHHPTRQHCLSISKSSIINQALQLLLANRFKPFDTPSDWASLSIQVFSGISSRVFQV